MITALLTRLSNWLTGSWLNLAVAGHDWVVPALQTVHILSVAVVLSGVLLINLRIIGWAERSQPVPAVINRFLSPVTIAVLVLLATGILQIVGEPNRAIFRTVFWLKMGMLVAALALTWAQRPLSAQRGGEVVEARLASKLVAVAALALWVAVIVAGRWIAYADPWAGAPS
jgi:hypothetical protein